MLETETTIIEGEEQLELTEDSESTMESRPKPRFALHRNEMIYFIYANTEEQALAFAKEHGINAVDKIASAGLFLDGDLFNIPSEYECSAFDEGEEKLKASQMASLHSK